MSDESIHLFLCKIPRGTKHWEMATSASTGIGKTDKMLTDDDGVVLEGVPSSLHGGDGAGHGTGTTCCSHCFFR